jgi:hypothetical protein
MTARAEESAAAEEVQPAAGRWIIRASWIGTALFVVSAVASAIAPNTFIAFGVATAGLLFFIGIGVFFWAYATAVSRSRSDLIGMGGLFFLIDSAPRRVQRSLWASLAVEVLVGLITAAVHPFTPLAFGVLAWMYGLALCGLWAARYGTFPPRPVEEKRGRGRTKAAAGSSATSSTTTTRTSGRTTPKGGGNKASTKRTTKTSTKGSSKTKGSSGSSSYL